MSQNGVAQAVDIPSDCYEPAYDKVRNGEQGWACPLDYSPVCGCNEKTYSNSCFASVNGILLWKPGPCPR